MPSFVFDIPLRDTHAVAASAGTGKTWNITALYLRILLEKKVLPEQILVVTYTLAATAELRTRIRRALQEAHEVFGGRDAAGDDFLLELLEFFPDHEKAQRRLSNALRTFDEAAIFTIHGFAQRVLGESAFESGHAFHVEMLADQNEILSECVEDFWRHQVHTGSGLWVRFLLENIEGPEALQAEIRELVGRPFEEVYTPSPPPDTGDEEGAFADAICEARELWNRDGPRIKELLAAKELSKNKYRPASLPGWYEALEDLLHQNQPTTRLFERFNKFTPAEITAGTKKNLTPPEHPFFEKCDEILGLALSLRENFSAQLRRLRSDLLDFCNQEGRSRKRERGVRGFNDLLSDLEEALTSRSTGPALARALRERYVAALIDEFQDTDPLQYSIFEQIYGESDNPVFLVGDPKQAIYGFRGADVFSYLQACRSADHRHTLAENWRSDPNVVTGVNALFEHQAQPFGLAEIPFTPSSAARPKLSGSLLEQAELPPLRLWFLTRNDSKPISEEAARERMAAATADEIARLLELRPELPERRLRGNDIAVLVRTHPQGLLIRSALAERGIPAVEESQDSVFATGEAGELERILTAISSPDDERQLRGALSTTLLGLDASELADLSESEQDWDRERNAFQTYLLDWLNEGFGPMFRRLLRAREIPQRLLPSTDGERRLTNLLQLGELLASESASGHRGCEKLLQWLNARRRAAERKDRPPDDHLLRLETDDELVQISTVHGCKGLEYPVVFVPFPWWTPANRSRETSFVTFHRPETQSGKPFLDLGGPDWEEHLRRAEREELAEELRLFYVAVTRAKYHCTFGWGAVGRKPYSGPAWLFHSKRASGGEGSAPLKIGFQNASDEELLRELQTVETGSQGSLEVHPLSPELPLEPQRVLPRATASSTPLVARTATREVRPRWSITSFSALRAGRSLDSPDHDRIPPEPALAFEPTEDLFGFPRGARSGICIHRLFELWDFTDSDPQRLRNLVEKTLSDFGFPRMWIPIIEKMMRDVAGTPLDDAKTLFLGNLTIPQRRDELEFHYPAGRLRLEGLNELLERHGYPGIPDGKDDQELPRPLVDGYVKGYIDLIFEEGGRYYLADYKSNWLGPDFDSYRPDALRDVVRRELYTLQYVTYTLALHRMLRLRLAGYEYERHLGGAYYLFVRGMRPDHGNGHGVFFDRPPRALIEELDERIGVDRVPPGGRT